MNEIQKQPAETMEATAPVQPVPFLRRQSGALYATGAVLLVAALAVFFVFYKSSRDDEQSMRLLGAAQSLKQFEELYARYPKSSAAPAALLAMAASRYAAGDFDAAAALYVEFAGKFPKHPMAPAAELGQAMCSEGRGEADKALMQFNSFILTHPDHFLHPQALFGKARCLQISGKPAEARIVYENFIAGHPESKWRAQAEASLQALERQMRANPGKG